MLHCEFTEIKFDGYKRENTYAIAIQKKDKKLAYLNMYGKYVMFNVIQLTYFSSGFAVKRLMTTAVTAVRRVINREKYI